MVLGQASTDSLTRQTIMVGQLDHRASQHLQRPAGATFGPVRTGGGDEKCFFVHYARRIKRAQILLAAEYRRNGVVNLFVFLDAHRPWRRVKITDHRSADDFALCMRELVDVDFKEAERIRVVLDNLSTHTAAALYAAFPPAEARRVLRRLEFHYTPKHASWLNMVEIEIGVLKGQCLDRRIESNARLVAEIDVWQSQRNQSGAKIKWMFSTEKARTKMARPYPDPSLKES